MTKLYCSFCGKRQDEIAKLIAGPTVHICVECVDLCHDICHPGAAPPPEPPRHAQIDPLLCEIRGQLLSIESRLTEIRLRLLDERPRPAQPPAGEIVGFGKPEET